MMKSFSSQHLSGAISTLALSFGLLAAACTEAPGTNDLLPPDMVPGTAMATAPENAGKDDVSQVQQALGAPGSLSPLVARGGTGGADFGTFDNGIVYAFRVRYGVRVDQIELAYYIPSAGTNFYATGNTLGSIGPFGGGGGIDSGWQYCPTGYGGRGFHGSSGTGIDKIGLICGNISDTSRLWFSPLFGGTGGSSFSDTCGSGGFLSGTGGRSGIWVDRLVGQCRAQ
jgi:hypothetical protein